MRNGKPEVSADEVRIMIEMHNNGCSHGEIALVVERSKKTVGERLRKNGLLTGKAWDETIKGGPTIGAIKRHAELNHKHPKVVAAVLGRIESYRAQVERGGPIEFFHRG